MRRYLFLDGDPAKLAGWRFILDRHDGHGPELQPAAMREGDAFPNSTVLCDRVGDCYQLTCLSNDEAQRAKLEASIAEAAGGAGLSLEPSKMAKWNAEAAALVALGQAVEPLGGEITLESCLAGDDPVLCADPDCVGPIAIVGLEPDEEDIEP